VKLGRVLRLLKLGADYLNACGQPRDPIFDIVSDLLKGLTVAFQTRLGQRALKLINLEANLLELANKLLIITIFLFLWDHRSRSLGPWTTIIFLEFPFLVLTVLYASWHHLNTERLLWEDLHGRMEIRLSKAAANIQECGLLSGKVVFIRFERQLFQIMTFGLAMVFNNCVEVLQVCDEIGQSSPGDLSVPKACVCVLLPLSCVLVIFLAPGPLRDVVTIPNELIVVSGAPK
jgi:hypothetical protein